MFMSNSTTVELRLRSDWVVTINYYLLAPDKLGLLAEPQLTTLPPLNSGLVIWFGNILSKP